MKSEWKEYTLDEVCERIFSGGTPSTMHSEYWNGTLKWLSSGETSQRFIYDTERKITEIGVKNSSTKLATKGCTVIATAGQGFTRGQASFLMTDTFLNQSVIACKANERFVLPLFLYYNLDNRYEEFRLLSDGTSTRGGLSGWILKRMTILLPPLDEQKKIVDILEKIDRKIEVNNAINHNLQQQAEALYKDYFVDFSATNGEVPPYWKKYCLSDFLPVITGKKNANISSEKGKYPFFSCSQDIAWTDDYSFEGSAILVAGNGDFNVKWYDGKFEAYQRTYVLIPYNQRYTAWLYYAIKYNLNKITSAARGSVIKFITKGNLEDFSFYAPSNLEKCDIIDTFTQFNDTIDALIQENYRLTSIRDALLPKLMRGEIDVSEVEV